MSFTISAALLFGAATTLLIAVKRVRIPAAACVWLSGFTAAATVLAGPVHTFLTALSHALPH